jgi:DNA-binding beta-propeller fold protein YncE
VAVDSQGRIFVADTGNNRVQELSPDGRLITQWGGAGSANGRFSGPKAIAVDASGHVYVADTGNNRVQVFAPPQGG